MNANDVLSQLRADPLATCRAYGFVVKYNATDFPSHLGGPCRIEISFLNDNIYKLQAIPGGDDFFFPYMHEDQPAGRCQVRDGRPDGTIIITGGMNGCALQVNKETGYKMFYHDANAVQLARQAIAGSLVCRIAYRDYDGPLEMGSRVTSYLEPYFFQTLLTIKVKGRWNVFHTGIKQSVSHEYSTYNSTVTPLLTSFDD